MENAKCGTCHHFRQHYRVDKRGYRTVACGHCTALRSKHRKPAQMACSLYILQQSSDLPDRQEVAHFLTIEVLQFILQFELPPETIE